MEAYQLSMHMGLLRNHLEHTLKVVALNVHKDYVNAHFQIKRCQFQ
jgi:hypothetical protein